LIRTIIERRRHDETAEDAEDGEGFEKMKNGWKQMTIAEAAEVLMGQSPSSNFYNTGGDGLPFFQGKADFGLLYPLPSKWCTQPLRKAVRHDILVSVRAPVGDVNLSSSECCIGRGLAALSCKKHTNPFFLFYLLLLSREEIEKHGTGTTFKSINKKVLESFEVSLPPLPEQKKIAAVLLKIQQAIRMQEKIIQSLRDLKKSTMHHLFTHGLRGEKTKMTEIGEIPESWEMVQLGELCQEGSSGAIQTGPFGSQLHASDYQATGVPVVNPTHMLNNEVIHEGIPRVNEENAKRLVRHALEVGDILFARRGEIGRHALINKEEAGWLCGTGCFLVRIRSSRVENDFISWCLYTSQSQEWLLAHAAGSIMPNLNNRILRACPVAFPKLAEQRRITETLNRIGGKLSLHKSKKSGLQDVFKTTLNKLMTGEIRVGNLDIDVSEVEV